MKEKSGERSLGLIANPENKFNLKFLLWNDQRVLEKRSQGCQKTFNRLAI